MKYILTLLVLISGTAFAQQGRDFMPAGAVMAFANPVCPDGWLSTDGTAISRTTYSRLFLAINTSSGSGNGTTTFHLPDYRGRFLRGVDGAVGRDTGRALRTAMNTGGNTGDSVGSVQADSFQGHWHQVRGNPNVFSSTSSGPVVTNIAGSTVLNPYAAEPISDGVNGTPRASSETRPTNANVIYCIKF